jgi:hypothetical protein
MNLGAERYQRERERKRNLVGSLDDVGHQIADRRLSGADGLEGAVQLSFHLADHLIELCVHLACGKEQKTTTATLRET